MSKYPDITVDIGDLYLSKERAKHPMYSYSRPAYNFWQGAYEGMRKAGKTHDEAMKILQSKAARWMLDKEDNKLRNLGRRMAKVLIELWG